MSTFLSSISSGFMQGLSGNAETHAQPGNNNIANAFLAGRVDAAAQKTFPEDKFMDKALNGKREHHDDISFLTRGGSIVNADRESGPDYSTSSLSRGFMQGLNGNAETHAQPGNNSIADAFLAGKVDAAAQKPLQVSGPLHGRILQPLDAITKSDTKSTTSQLNEFGHPIDLGLVVLEIPTKTRIGDIIPPNFV